MGEYADYEIDRMIDQGWGWGRPRGWGFSRPKKKTNQEIFKNFENEEKPIDPSKF